MILASSHLCKLLSIVTRGIIDMDFHERSEEEPATDMQEVLNVFSTLGGSDIWQLEWLIDRVEDSDGGMSWL